MEILYLIDRLESLIGRARKVPLGRGTVVDREEILSILDQMRISIPKDLREAQRLNSEREELLTKARQDAESTLASAREAAEKLTTSGELLKSAEDKRSLLLREAQQEAERLRREADDYAIKVLGELEDRLVALETTVRNGLEHLQSAGRDRSKPVGSDRS